MNHLSNAFSLLELDLEDAMGESVVPASSDNNFETREHSNDDEFMPICENKAGQTTERPPAVFKMPLLWIDLEMTGLNVEVDRVLEIACVITDGNLKKSIEGPDLVIHQTKECLDKMGQWCQDHHLASGLTEKVLHSTITEQEAEREVIEFVTKHIGPYTPLIAGNSVYVDLIFLRKYMPDLAALFSHVIVDVSSIKALCLRWYPRDNRKAPRKNNKHRAMDDIKESIAELKFYKDHIFKPSKSKI
ncbi:oligoribonuclease-like isoform X2 [Andrographis paniculata]|uniref:oligoribonuclease-like isoform X2 n=1 Tax=Andrographis paniculata TaxID=175694 RepID=UPI0021E86AEF|nr:oligoribonuclease-like isoform X2 [Andrographis paniculata]